jgi:hypothetical protein
MIPVGGIHLSISSQDPAVGFGYGVWSRIGGGRVLIGVQEADVDFEDAELTGGAKAVTPAGSVSQPTFTGAAMTGVMNHTHTVSITDPGHNHTQNSHNHTQDSHNHTQNSFAPRILNSGTAGTVGVQGASAASNANASNAATTATNQATTATNQAATATNQSNTTGISASTANPAGGVSSITPSGTVSQPTFTGVQHSNLPPYLTVYMWVRTE